VAIGRAEAGVRVNAVRVAPDADPALAAAAIAFLASAEAAATAGAVIPVGSEA
jgi:hypothetical protein